VGQAFDWDFVEVLRDYFPSDNVSEAELVNDRNNAKNKLLDENTPYKVLCFLAILLALAHQS
jgi:hypothetical protein